MARRKKPTRIKRAHLKRFSAEYINVGSTGNVNVIKEYAARVQVEDERVTKLLFGVPMTIESPHKRMIDGVAFEANMPNVAKRELNIEIIERRRRIAKQAKQLRELVVWIGEPGLYNHVELSPTHTMFYNNKKTRVFVVHVDYRHGVLRRSQDYQNEDLCKRAFMGGWLKWIATKPLEIPE